MTPAQGRAVPITHEGFIMAARSCCGKGVPCVVSLHLNELVKRDNVYFHPCRNMLKKKLF